MLLTPDQVQVITGSQSFQAAAAVLRQQPDLDFAVLVGSRATAKSSGTSDWDVALHWSPALDLWTILARTETMRRALAGALGVPETSVDLIDLRRANLTMRASVAEDGLPLCGKDSLAWARFLTRTWRELEDFYWDQQHAA